jgi:hypothetical protein
MKSLTITLLASASLAAAAFAGTEITSSKDKKVVAPTTCFNDHELQLDVFGAYAVGEGPNHAGPIRDHGWGGGIGINYFFSRYIGVGAEGIWLDAKENSASNSDSNGGKAFHSVGGSLIFRYPIDSLCLAPYGYVGGAAVMDGAKWAEAFVGVGLEYRVVPNKVGIFVDERWDYLGDRFGHDTQNNFMTRAGVRWVF